jgi:hypothetical protein
MAITVAVIVSRKFRARAKVCPDLIAGVRAAGDKVIEIRADEYRGVVSDVAMFYGFDGSRDSRICKAFNDYKNAGKKAIYLDLGYWHQHRSGFDKQGRLVELPDPYSAQRSGDPEERYGFHRFSINARHPDAYFQNVKHPDDRAKRFKVKIRPWRNGAGRNVLVCGMSMKCAAFEGFAFEEWERSAIAKLKTVTDRPIIYRPKPQRSRSRTQYPAIEGVGYSDPTRSVLAEIQNAWAFVSHHSNVGLDALVHGVPCFQDAGVALACGLSDLAEIERPRTPTDDERKQLINDVAYCQWSRPEMASGAAWRHLKNENLV